MVALQRFWRSAVVLGLVAAGLTPMMQASPAAALVLPAGFREQIVFSGLNQPTNVEFAPDGRVFIAEKTGRVKIFHGIADTTSTTFADLTSQVHSQWDRGLLGLALPPDFPVTPYVYVLYTYGTPLGGGPVMDDSCTGAEGGPAAGNCVVSARLSRLRADGDAMTGAEDVLINDWCQQFPSHSIGDLHFGPDGALYVSAGDGASFSGADYGQMGSPINPCADPPGGPMSLPGAEGGALRAQDLRTSGDPATLDGSIIRVDPQTGAAASGNPLIGSADPNARRIIAHGLRNPFRFTFRPGTSELWVGDVGHCCWEEINRIVDPTGGTVPNFGWPCYEGVAQKDGFKSLNLSVCQSLYTGGGVTAPYLTYDHNTTKDKSGVIRDKCSAGGDSVAGLAFYPTSGGSYPNAYKGALFFADYSRQCIFAMKPTTAGGLPSAANIELFALGAAAPTDLAIGPAGELYYVDHTGGTLRRFRYFPGNQPPFASLDANLTSGGVPLTVEFSAAGSSDPDPADQGALTYEWDFTNDGTVDARTVTATHTYTAAGNYTAKLTVTDGMGAATSSTVSIQPGNEAPTAYIDSPAPGFTWAVGQKVTFSGHGTDPQDGTLDPAKFTWQLRMEHCASVGNCHVHNLEEWPKPEGSNEHAFFGPDHDYPSYLELVLTVTDTKGLTSQVTRRLDPKTVDLVFVSNRAGLALTVGSTSRVTPFVQTVIQGSTVTVSAPTPQRVHGPRIVQTYQFSAWSDKGSRVHEFVAPAIDKAYSAVYRALVPQRTSPWSPGATGAAGLRGPLPSRYGAW